MGMKIEWRVGMWEEWALDTMSRGSKVSEGETHQLFCFFLVWRYTKFGREKTVCIEKRGVQK